MRLFIQDFGVICPLGTGKTPVAQALFAGRDDALTRRDDLLAGRSVLTGTVNGDLPAIPPALDCRNNRMMQAALDEIRRAINAAIECHGPDRIAVVCGTSTSGIAEGETALAAYRRTGRWPDSYHYHQQEAGSISRFVARTLGLRGPAYTIATACSSSGKVFASARRLIAAGLADAVVVGGADTLCGMTMGGFGALEALSPTRCNPFSVNRDGITIGEGAAAFLIGRAPAPIELLGVGETSDAHHPTAPDPDGAGAKAAIDAALHQAGLTPADIGYVNLHGTATPLNDAMESRVIADTLGLRVPVSSTKSMTGHMLGATGGVEAAFLCMALTAGRLPPHLWDGEADPTLPALNFVTRGQTAGVNRAMLSTSFGFGGSNAALVLGAAFVNAHPGPIAALLPHDYPMVLLDQVDGWDDLGLTASVMIRGDTRFQRPGEGVPSHVGLEWMAQACGAYAGATAARSGKPVRIGYLLGTRDFTAAQGWFRLGEILTVTVRQIFHEDGMAVFDCRIDDANTNRATARLSVFQPSDDARAHR